MDDFGFELKNGFLEEARGLMLEAEQCFLMLEQNPEDKPIFEKIFRVAHNLKGSSKAVGFDSLGAFTHEFESLLVKFKNGTFSITPLAISLLLKCVDHINHSLEKLKADHAADCSNMELMQKMRDYSASSLSLEDSQSQNKKSIEFATPSDDIVDAALLAQADAIFDSLQAKPIAKSLVRDLEDKDQSIYVSELKKLTDENLSEIVDNILFDFKENKFSEDSIQSPVEAVKQENIIPFPQIVKAVEPQSEIQENSTVKPTQTLQSRPQSSSHAHQVDESIRVSLSRVEKLLNFVGEMVILQTVLREQINNANPQLLKTTIHQMGKVTQEVQDISMSLRMVPLKQTFQKMQRIVRDTTQLLKKDVQLVLEGEDTEVDKVVLEALNDPLVHVIRNAVDHGIEEPSERLAHGKSPTGTIFLRAFHQSGKLVIEIKDDGAGINAAQIRKKALEKGLIKPESTLSDQDLIQMIFYPGFSTKAEVTEVSGRGVGMDVVKTNIEQLQGEVLVETVVQQGSVFKIILPLTLAIIEGIIIRCGDERFIIPLSHVHESLRPLKEDLRLRSGLGEVLLLRGENLPAYRLSNILGRKQKNSSPSEEIAIIVRTQSNPFATLVDDIIGQHQVVVKKLGAEVQSNKGYSGSAILGDGKPALILELADLVSGNRGLPVRK